MVEQHASTEAVVTGSTHNERIERLWRDVSRCVNSLFAGTFRKLEAEGQLDSLNEIDMFCRHVVFLPRINEALHAFVESWNNHPVSTANNLTPNQLFVQGAIEQNMAPAIPNTSCRSTGSSIPASHDHVQVPRAQFDPCTSLCQQLDRVNVLQSSNDFGHSI